MLEEILGFRVESAGGERGQRLMEAARGPVEDGVFPVGVISRVDCLILHDLRENLLRDCQLELVTTLSGTQVVEPLLLREGKDKKNTLEFRHKALSIRHEIYKSILWPQNLRKLSYKGNFVLFMIYRGGELISYLVLRGVGCDGCDAPRLSLLDGEEHGLEVGARVVAVQ